MLFLSKQARPDIQTGIAFLSTRVRDPNKDDWKKLRKVIQYLFGTLKTVQLHLNVNNMNVVHWWVDSSYGIHRDLKGQTGASISIGKGCVTNMLKKKKVNTTSSTISELVGVHKSTPQVLWTKSFLRNQWFKIDDATLYQDNKSAMLLEKNGRASTSIRKKHIDILYFSYRTMSRLAT